MMSFVLIAVVLVVVGVVIMLSRRRSDDGVETFQRQIDALSSEARRPVVDQVQQVAGDDSVGDEPADGRQADDDEPDVR